MKIIIKRIWLYICLQYIKLKGEKTKSTKVDRTVKKTKMIRF